MGSSLHPGSFPVLVSRHDVQRCRCSDVPQCTASLTAPCSAVSSEAHLTSPWQRDIVAPSLFFELLSLKPSNPNPNCFTPETQTGFPAPLPGAVQHARASSRVPGHPPLPLPSAFSSHISAAARHRVSLCSWKFSPDPAPSTAEGNLPALASPEIAFTVLFFFFERFILLGNEGGDRWDRGKPRSNPT